MAFKENSHIVKLVKVMTCACLILMLSLSNALAEKKKLNLCYTTWGQHGGKDLPGQGFIPDLVTRVFEHANYEVSVDIIPWPRCITLAKEQRYDLVASGWRGENFDPFFEYLNITLRNDISFIVRKDSEINSGELKNFEGKKVSYVRESGGMDPIRQNKKIISSEVSKMTSLIPILHRGRIDAVITDPESFFIAAEKMNPPINDHFKILKPALHTNFNSPLVPKGHPDLEQLRTDFDKSFKALIKGGIFEELIKIHGPQFEYQIPMHARKTGE